MIFFSQESYDLATRFYKDDFNRINVSRPFSALWKDVLLNPFVAWRYLCSLKEILSLIENLSFEYYSYSPSWITIDHLNWYKNVVDPTRRHKAIVDLWYNYFSFFITGLPFKQFAVEPAADEIDTFA